MAPSRFAEEAEERRLRRRSAMGQASSTLLTWDTAGEF